MHLIPFLQWKEEGNVVIVISLLNTARWFVVYLWQWWFVYVYLHPESVFRITRFPQFCLKFPHLILIFSSLCAQEYIWNIFLCHHRKCAFTVNYPNGFFAFVFTGNVNLTYLMKQRKRNVPWRLLARVLGLVDISFHSLRVWF